MSDRGVGLSGLANSESSHEVVGRYDSWVSDYENDVRSWGYTLPEQLAERLVAASNDRPPGRSHRLLDAGCGTGLVGRALVNAGFVGDIIGIDISQQSMRAAAADETYAALAASSISDGLPFAPASFDAVVCGGVLTYVPDTEAALREFLRLLTFDGVAVVSQRTDLWAGRGCDDVVQRLRGSGATVEVAAPQPYLPGLDDYGTDIEVVLVTLRPGK